MVFELLFWFSVLALLHTYLFYPLFVILIAKIKKTEIDKYSIDDELPEVSVIMAVRNEEAIIEKKINSVFESAYPQHKINFYIGSDASIDDTDKIIIKLNETYENLVFKRFEKRMGKVEIINELSKIAKGEIFLLTDANAIFCKDSIFNLIKYFKNPEIHIVGGRMKNKNNSFGPIAFQEQSYLEMEYQIKYAESKLWGCMIGAFGAFYAVRKDFFNPIPPNFISDDFYITLKAIEKNGKAIFNPEAVVNENVPGLLQEEFKRKSRIATGNFQNLGVFWPMLFSRRFGLAFSFLSHKVLRWFGPVFLILGFISIIIIFNQNFFYTIVFIIILLTLVAPIIDYFHKKNQIPVILLRFIAHFYYMNFALLLGLFKYLKGVKSNVWEPTKRY